MDERMNALRAAHRKLADAKTHAETQAASLERVRANEAANDREFEEWQEEQQAREAAHEAKVITAIAADQSVPPYLHDCTVFAERERLEAQKRATALARVQFEREHSHALKAVAVAERRVNVAADAILAEEASKLAARRQSIKAELAAVERQLRAYETSGGKLSNEHTFDVWNIPRAVATKRFYDSVEEDQRNAAGPSDRDIAIWHERRATLIVGIDCEAATPAEATA